MNADMKRLVELQDVMVKLWHVREDLTKVPEARKLYETARDEAQAEFEKAKATLEANETDKRRMDVELSGLESTAQKYREQLMSVKTNKEYQTMLTEIQTVQGLVSDLETELLGRMESIETEKARLEAAEAQLKKSNAVLEMKNKELGAKVAALKEEEAGYVAQENEAKKDIPAALMTRFSRLAARRQGIALSAALEERCTQCQERMRPQEWHEVRHTEKVIVCDGCGRILYFTGLGDSA